DAALRHCRGVRRHRAPRGRLLALEGAAGGVSNVPRSMRAETAPAAARAAEARRSLPNGWWGAALLIATETALFGSMIASYFYLRLQAVQWPPPGIPAPMVPRSLALTGASVAAS